MWQAEIKPTYNDLEEIVGFPGGFVFLDHLCGSGILVLSFKDKGKSEGERENNRQKWSTYFTIRQVQGQAEVHGGLSLANNRPIQSMEGENNSLTPGKARDHVH